MIGFIWCKLWAIFQRFGSCRWKEHNEKRTDEEKAERILGSFLFQQFLPPFFHVHAQHHRCKGICKIRWTDYLSTVASLQAPCAVFHFSNQVLVPQNGARASQEFQGFSVAKNLPCFLNRPNLRWSCALLQFNLEVCGLLGGFSTVITTMLLLRFVFLRDFQSRLAVWQFHNGGPTFLKYQVWIRVSLRCISSDCLCWS